MKTTYLAYHYMNGDFIEALESNSLKTIWHYTYMWMRMNINLCAPSTSFDVFNKDTDEVIMSGYFITSETGEREFCLYEYTHQKEAIICKRCEL